ncbi:MULTISPECIES: hypothetical protein [Streptomyces]|uniref:hypothetical protein n=1 Tax=Streptomyces TaxID=1883 RepID=UPI0018727BDF|nr:hypothetical protein [Streptomyces caniscabiei]MBE4783938.1 hypothetical protein [Streptomyces caniscabiei]MBE4791563.1 hypothetical protein [Streptomyces caniscabiei]MDX3009200.1 hypothetical protein [Streptomyces caniscabiei]
MSQPTVRDQRAHTHIKALAAESKTLTEGTAGTPAMAFGSGMLTGLAAAVQVLEGGTAEGAMETIVQRLETAIGKAYLAGDLPPTPPAARDQIAAAIRSFPFDDYGMDDVSYALEDTPETQEWVPALADAVLAAVRPVGLVDLLKRTEAHLSALHGSVAWHDNLGANLACSGCELRDAIRTALKDQT